MKGIGISPVGSDEVKNALNSAIDKGINVICFDGDMPSVHRKSFVGTDNVKAGMLVGEIIAKLLDEKGKVICAIPNLGQGNMAKRLKGFKEGVRAYTNIDIVAIEDSNGADMVKRTKNIKELIMKHQDFDGLVCLDSRSCKVAKMIKDEMKLNPKIVAFDKTDHGIELLEKDYIHSIVVQRSSLWGEVVVRRLYELRVNKQIPSTEDTGTFEMNKKNYKVFL